jgi:hypothetical protein
LRVASPVLVIVAVTFKFSNPSTLGVWDRCLDGQAGDSRDGDRIGEEGDEGGAEVREEYRGEGSEGDSRDGSKESLDLNELA